MIFQLLLASCFAIESEKIVAGDLAKAVAAFGSIAADTFVGHAPTPGAVRVFQAGELSSLAMKYGMPEAGAQSACFEWTMRQPSREDALRAMTASLGSGEIEIQSLSSHRVPPGEIVFPRAALGAVAGSDGAINWKGYVLYGSTRKFDIWARVKISAAQVRVVMKEAVAAGTPISESSLSLENYAGLPASKDIATSIDQVAGRIAKRPLAAGSAVHLAVLDTPKAVLKGDLVQVEARVGQAVLLAAGKALTGGAVGSSISVENIESKRTFTARIEAPGKVVVER